MMTEHPAHISPLLPDGEHKGKIQYMMPSYSAQSVKGCCAYSYLNNRTGYLTLFNIMMVDICSSPGAGGATLILP